MKVPFGNSQASILEAINYQERLVAFIDVLGFTELVKASDTDATARVKIDKLIATDKFFEEFVDTYLSGITAHGAFFSDSFIFSMTPDRIIYLVRELGYLCRRLLLLGFPCRGAVVSGSFYHHNRIYVGPAFIHAYKLEQSVAVYPRVILDDTAMKRWEYEFRIDEDESSVAHPHLKTLVKQDRDGQYFLDIFSPHWFEFMPWTDFITNSDLPSPPDTASSFLHAAQQIVAEGIKEYKDNPRILAKYNWLYSQIGDYASQKN